jgi:hypothetical protein
MDHGFDSAAQARTRGALEADRSPTPDTHPLGGYDFYLPLDPAGGTRCRQKVVVSARADFGVITSYVEAY